MRTTPKPRFHYDELVQRGPQLEKLIGQAVSQDQARAEQTPDDDPSLFSSSATKEN
jgi:hypothetical protein